jgi:MFS transporter, FSR family, fosmidomycin resistance protein
VSSPTQIDDTAGNKANTTVFAILFAISFSHLLNDTIQSLLPALFPIIKDSFALTFTQIGLISLAFQMTAAFLQPVVGLVADYKPLPFSLVTGMGLTCAGVLLLAGAPSFLFLLLAAVFIGLGSAIFHPESSRVARMAAGNKRGLAQSLFQVGGNAGSAMGPLLAAFVIVVIGQSGIAWFAVIPILGMITLWYVGRWYADHIQARPVNRKAGPGDRTPTISSSRLTIAISILLLLIFSKQFYMASLTNYYTFYLIKIFGVAVPTAQIYLFVYLFSIAIGTLVGGWLSDHFGRKLVIWFSILGALPFTLALPHVDLFWTVVLTGLIGMIMASSLSVILVFAQDLVPGKIGLVSGLFLGFGFGMGGLGALLLGRLADQTSLEFVYLICSFLPLFGLITAFLPSVGSSRR